MEIHLQHLSTFYDPGGQFKRIGPLAVSLHEFSYQTGKSVEFTQSPGIETGRIPVRLLNHSPEAYVAVNRCTCQLGESCLPDASRREIDHTSQRLVIIRIQSQTEIGNGVLYLLALVERQTTVNPVRHIAFSQSLFQHTALGIGTI